jgi:methanogenic corrinoid protein MtbC1
MEKLIEEIQNKVINGKHAEIEALVENAIESELNLDDLINNALIGAMVSRKCLSRP